MLTKLKINKEQSNTCTYTDYLYDVCGRPADQITIKALERVTATWLPVSILIRDRVFDQIESSLRETYDAY